MHCLGVLEWKEYWQLTGLFRTGGGVTLGYPLPMNFEIMMLMNIQYFQSKIASESISDKVN